MSTTGLFLMHTVIMLYCTFFFMLCLCLTVWASNWIWRGEDLCVCCTVYRLEPEAGSSTEASVCSVIVLSEESLMEPFVVFLLISFKEILFACLRPWQRSLCVFGNLVLVTVRAVLLRVSLSLFITVPLSESSYRDEPTVSFELSWQTGLFNSSRCQSER